MDQFWIALLGMLLTLQILRLPLIWLGVYR